jgi:hypothetical protein
MFRLTLLCGLTLASSAVAIGGLLSYHYYPAIIAVAITGILIWAIVTMMVDESRHNKERRSRAFANSDADERWPYATLALLDSGALGIESAAKPQPQHAHIALKRPDGMGEHTGPIPLNQEMPAPGKYIAQHHTKNRYHGIEHDDA